MKEKELQYSNWEIENTNTQKESKTFQEPLDNINEAKELKSDKAKTSLKTNLKQNIFSNDTPKTKFFQR